MENENMAGWPLEKKEIIGRLERMARGSAYRSRVFGELCACGFDADFMKASRDVEQGRAFGGVEILAAITGEPCAGPYLQGAEEAGLDILKTGRKLAGLLGLVGIDGKSYLRARGYDSEAVAKRAGVCPL